jgi:hypothetical protein
MTVNPLMPVSVSIAASANPVAAGTTVTFTASPENGGTLPVYQWKVNGKDAAGASNVTYSYKPSDGDVVTCRLNSNAACAVNNPATSNSLIMSVTSVPLINVLQNINITGTQCYDAIQTITVAGSGTTFTVQNGGSATMIAGQNIIYLPGTLVKPGGYMHGYITTTAQYCIPMQSGMVAAITGDGEITFGAQDLRVKIYPNPTAGEFTLEITGWAPANSFRAEIFSMNGIRVMANEFTGDTKYPISLRDVPSGLFFLRIVAKDKVETIKIIKSN